MGIEKRVMVSSDRRSEEAKVSFEGDHVRVGKPFSRTFHLPEMQAVEVDGAALVLTAQDGRYRLEVGPDAAKLAERMRHPKRRIDKMGFKPGSHVALLHFEDVPLAAECAAAGVNLMHVNDAALLREDAGCVIVEANAPHELLVLDDIAQRRPAAAVWVVSFKGKKLLLSDREVMAEASKRGYVSTKVVAFDADRTALRFVRRKT